MVASFNFEVTPKAEAMQRGVNSTKEIIDGILEGMSLPHGEKVLIVDLLANRPTNCLFFIRRIVCHSCAWFNFCKPVWNTLEVQ